MLLEENMLLVFCSSCRTEVMDGVKFCPKCGNELNSTSSRHTLARDYYHNRSAWWYLLPLFLGILGGIIAFFVVRKDDPKLAKKCLIFGIVISIIGFMIGIISRSM